MNETYATWEKLLNLKKQWAVERAELEASAAAQKKEREWREKQKTNDHTAILEEAKVEADVA